MIVIIKKNEKLTGADFAKAREDYGTYIKFTVDTENKVAALGGEFHADAEKILLELGSKQSDIWGGGVNLETKSYDTSAIINLRSGRNNSTEILDEEVRNQFLRIAREILKNHV